MEDKSHIKRALLWTDPRIIPGPRATQQRKCVFLAVRRILALRNAFKMPPSELVQTLLGPL
jgi:hypothetical protein